LFDGPVSIPQIDVPKSRDRKAPTTGNHFDEEMRMYAKMEEKRFRAMLDIVLKFKEYEDEKLKVQMI